MATVEMKRGLQPERWQRRLLPGSMVDGPGAGRSLRDWAVDALVTIVALVLGAFAVHDTWVEHGVALKIVDLALGLAAVAALWDRRRHPVGVAAFVLPVSVISTFAGGAGLIVLFNAAIRCGRRELAWITLAAVTCAAANSVIYASSVPDLRDDLVLGLLMFGFTIGWGLFVRVRRDLVDSLRERNAQLEEDGLLRADRARAAERERIAREMHDVLAHRISLLSLHAGALEYRPDAPPEEIAATAGVVREAAAEALEELRDVIGVLREGTDAESRPPQPTLADLPALVEESRAAGMRIEADLDFGEDDAGSVGRTAFRIVQEALTNARKHAPGTLVRVRVERAEDGELTIEVRNRAPLTPAPTLPGAGSGLIGIGERVELIGGELRHEFAAGGDFVLAATLPAEVRPR
ncbi:MAG TPA: histidine kinase [Solirubrobacterales bacterium]